jgi:ribose transport system substrate-binding protein
MRQFAVFRRPSFTTESSCAAAQSPHFWWRVGTIDCVVLSRECSRRVSYSRSKGVENSFIPEPADTKDEETMKNLLKHSARILSVGLLAGSTSIAALAEESVLVTKQGDIAPMCGTKPMVVGLSDGYGGETWRKTAVAELKDEVSRCKNLKRFMYTNANGDQQKANSDINSMVAQGVNVLVVFPDFGAAQIPAMRAATKAGVTVVPYLAKVPGNPGKDYAVNVTEDVYRMGTVWADWFGKNVKKGNVVFLGGAPGALSSQIFFDGFRTGIAKYPDLKLLENNFVVTNWTPVDAQKAVAGLIAKYPKIDGVATDYGVTALAAVKAFQQAHLPVPAIATNASNNELNCKYLSLKKAGTSFPYFSLDGTTSVIRFAGRRAVATYQGTPNSEPMMAFPFPYADSATGVDPKCDPSAPPDADFSSALSVEKLKAVFEQ